MQPENLGAELRETQEQLRRLAAELEEERKEKRREDFAERREYRARSPLPWVMQRVWAVGLAALLGGGSAAVSVTAWDEANRNEQRIELVAKEQESDETRFEKQFAELRAEIAKGDHSAHGHDDHEHQPHIHAGEMCVCGPRKQQLCYLGAHCNEETLKKCTQAMGPCSMP
jgi:hypothetical protein